MEKEHFISIIKNFVLSFSVVGIFASFVTLVFFTILDFFGVLSSSLLLSLPIIFIIFSFIAIWLNKIYWEFMNEIKKIWSRIWSCKRKWLSNWKWIHRFINAHINFNNRIYHFSIKKFSKWLKRALGMWFRARCDSYDAFRNFHRAKSFYQGFPFYTPHWNHFNEM